MGQERRREAVAAKCLGKALLVLPLSSAGIPSFAFAWVQFDLAWDVSGLAMTAAALTMCRGLLFSVGYTLPCWNETTTTAITTITNIISQSHYHTGFFFLFFAAPRHHVQLRAMPRLVVLSTCSRAWRPAPRLSACLSPAHPYFQESPAG